jgi:hypothetical protein
MARSKLSVHHPVEPVDFETSGEGHKFDFTGIPRFKADGGSGRDAKAEPAGLLAIKLKRAVGFKEMEVASHLDWAVSPVRDDNLSHFKADIGFKGVIAGWDNFSRDHRIGL